MAQDAAMSLPENLALCCQELFTAIVRLRSPGQPDPTSAEAFRQEVLGEIRAAKENAKARNYSDEDTHLAVYAVVGFLDESILNGRKPVFADWARKPLQQQLFGQQVAGELFFEHLTEILARRDRTQVADLLEVYYLCLLLGFSGGYASSSRGDLTAWMTRANDKIKRIRGGSSELSPQGMLPIEPARISRADPWTRYLAIAAAISAFLALTLFIGYRLSLSSEATSLQVLSVQDHQ
jgi:type VI secretion system protein ImpK